MPNRLVFLRGLKVWAAGLAVLLFCGLATTARAYDTPAQRFARLSYIHGNVTVSRIDGTDSEAAQLNMPLAEGAQVTTAEDGQAEVEFEDGSLVRLTPNSSLSVDQLSVDAGGDYQTQLNLVRGLVYAELRAASKYAYELNVDGAVVSPVENATIRINLDEPPAVIAVLTGRAHVEHTYDAGSYRADVRGGETLTADPFDAGRYFLSQQITEDSWDTWNEERDQAAADEAAARTAARDRLEGAQGYGWSDLDANGSWYDVPGQGQVWQPTVAMNEDFDPYGYGSWVWSPGGYAWASGYSWGWTPFRCGNWSFWNGFGWGWSPGVNCGFGGWGFPGGVFVINIIRPPRGYPFPVCPVRSPIGVHPIVVVHHGQEPAMPVGPVRGPRTIGGHVGVEPLRPVGNGYKAQGGSVLGASLQRDFPMDRNHQPVIGRVADSSASGLDAEGAPVVRPASESHSSDAWRQRSARAGDGAPTSGQPMRPAPPSSQRMDAAQGLHPAQGQQDDVRRAPRPNPPGRSYVPAEASRPAPPRPIARPVYPSSYQAPRSMGPPPAPRPMSSAPSPRPSSPSAPAAPRAAASSAPAAPRAAASPK